MRLMRVMGMMRMWLMRVMGMMRMRLVRMVVMRMVIVRLMRVMRMVRMVGMVSVAHGRAVAARGHTLRRPQMTAAVSHVGGRRRWWDRRSWWRREWLHWPPPQGW